MGPKDTLSKVEASEHADALLDASAAAGWLLFHGHPPGL